MNSKHTPGPWNFSKDGAEIFPETGPNGYVELCRVVGPWDGSKFYDKGTAKANARLIAAAPDLLKAAKLAQAYMETCDGKFARSVDEDLKEAIAKAEASHV